MKGVKFMNWEYKALYTAGGDIYANIGPNSPFEQINEYGKDGWELVSIASINGKNGETTNLHITSRECSLTV